MFLKIIGIKKNADPDSEYIKFKVLKDCNFRDFGVTDEASEVYEDATNRNMNFYRHYKNLHLVAGDIVKLYSGRGEYKLVRSTPPVHKCFWGMDTCLWGIQGDKAKVFRLEFISEISL